MENKKPHKGAVNCSFSNMEVKNYDLLPKLKDLCNEKNIENEDLLLITKALKGSGEKVSSEKVKCKGCTKTFQSDNTGAFSTKEVANCWPISDKECCVRYIFSSKYQVVAK